MKRRVKRVERRAVTIRDIARRAGVSTATVSRALAEPQKVSDEAKARVMAVVREVGYRPNAVARNLRSRSTRMVLVIVPNLANRFATGVLRGLDDELVLAGYDLLIGSLDNDLSREARFVRLAASGQVDAIVLLTGRVPTDGDRRVTELGLPAVSVGAFIADFEGPQVVVDDRAAAAGVARHLLALGHRSFGYARGPAGNVNERDRGAGYVDALEAEGIDADAISLWPGTYTVRSGSERARTYLDMPPERRPTAVFAAGDVIAIGFMKAVLEAGLDVPGDLSIVGFDGIDVTRYVTPTLATVRQPSEDMGRAGARAVLDQLQSKPRGEPRIVLPTELIPGESTGRAARQSM